MRFEKGNKLATGRPKGGIGTRKKRVEELAKELDCDPLEILMRFAKGDWKGLGYKSATRIRTYGESSYEEDVISTDNRIQAAKESTQYMYAKLKTIEVVKQNAFEGMNLSERLEAMKNAVAILEKQIKDGNV